MGDRRDTQMDRGAPGLGDGVEGLGWGSLFRDFSHLSFTYLYLLAPDPSHLSRQDKDK